jgi:hypothetical protein
MATPRRTPATHRKNALLKQAAELHRLMLYSFIFLGANVLFWFGLNHWIH